jgi:hypothetical protein
MAKAHIPVMKAERIHGHAARESGHSRDKLGRIAPMGSKARQPLTQPPSRAKTQRKSPRSGARAGAGARIPRDRIIGSGR